MVLSRYVRRRPSACGGRQPYPPFEDLSLRSSQPELTPVPYPNCGRALIAILQR